ncbi:hypothetical protein [Allochromatium palmeri]|uniref:hypothetical protein n=1 Tax=Allochromatium palmeri TaxID=231048 RepID=UPI003CCC9DB3
MRASSHCIGTFPSPTPPPCCWGQAPPSPRRRCASWPRPGAGRILRRWRYVAVRGDRTWQTPITQQGLETLHRLLRKTARKNTAVACHWIRDKDHSEA